MAQKRRLGPWARAGAESADPLVARKTHEKAVAAMLRAGHQYDHVKHILGAGSPQDVEDWVAEAADEEGMDGQW
jgi:regulatory protein